MGIAAAALFAAGPALAASVQPFDDTRKLCAGQTARLERLEGIDTQPWSGLVYRVAWEGGDPAQGSSGKKGRWSSPRGEFEILYTSLQQAGAEAEFEAFGMLFEQRPDRSALYQGAVIKTHRDGFPWFSARRARRRDALGIARRAERRPRATGSRRSGRVRSPPECVRKP